LSVAVFFGAWHDHHEHGHTEDCAACLWQLAGHTDLPVATDLPVVATPPFQSVVIPSDRSVPAPFDCVTANRGPPELA
jgi:hypothetical protein